MKEGGEGGREEVTIRGWKEMRCGAGNVNHLVMCTYIRHTNDLTPEKPLVVVHYTHYVAVWIASRLLDS